MVDEQGELRAASDHIIVVGLHGIGLRVIEELLAVGQTVIVIDDDPDDRSARQISHWQVPHVVANAARTEVLLSAGVESARAVICLEGDELRTLEIALLVNELNPAVQLVVRSPNSAVGSAIEAVVGPGSVLEAESLSAPALCDVLLDRNTREFDVYGRSQQVVVETVADDCVLGERFGSLTALALSQDGQTTLFPNRTSQLRGGDRIAVSGSRELLATMRLSAASAPTPPVTVGARYGRYGQETPSGSVRGLWLAVFYGADRAFKVTLLLFVALTVVATAVIDIWYVNGPEDDAQMDLVDALYTAVQTVVTVGYGDFPFGDQPVGLRIFDIVLMLVGTALVAVLFAQLTDLLVSRRIAASFGSARAASMRNHFVVIGFGRSGARVVEILRSSGKQVAVIDLAPTARRVARARALRVPVVLGDATDPATLAAVNIRQCAGVAVVTSNDLINVETGLAIREAFDAHGREVPVVLRLFDRHLSATVRTAFGFHDALSTAALAAPWFVAAGLGLNVLCSFTVLDATFMAGTVSLDERSALLGRDVRELAPDIQVVAVRRQRDVIQVGQQQERVRLQIGDEIAIIGMPTRVLELLSGNTATAGSGLV